MMRFDLKKKMTRPGGWSMAEDTTLGGRGYMALYWSPRGHDMNT
jgi:hypothetical protein